MMKSGAAASILPECKHFKQMAFLHEKSSNLPTESNVVITPSVASSEYLPTKRKPKESSLGAPKTKQLKQQDNFESSILNELGMVNNAIKATDEDDDEDKLYCRSLIPIMKSLPKRKRRLAKIKISQLLFDMEFEEE